MQKEKAERDFTRLILDKDIIVINSQMRNANRPSLTKLCECGSGKLYKKCHGVDGGAGILIKKNEAFCLPTGGSGGQYIVENNSNNPGGKKI